MTRKNKSPPEQTSMFDAFAAADYEAKTAHLPSSTDAAIPHFQSIIDRYHAALLAGQPESAAAIHQEAEDLAIRLNGGTRCGIKGDKETAPCGVLERATAAAPDEIPKWGQTGNFTIDVNGCRIRIEFEGLYGICLPQFSIHAIDYDKPFFSETGYRSFMNYGFDCTGGGITVDRYVQSVIEQYLSIELKGRLLRIDERYKKMLDNPPTP